MNSASFLIFLLLLSDFVSISRCWDPVNFFCCFSFWIIPEHILLIEEAKVLLGQYSCGFSFRGSWQT